MESLPMPHYTEKIWSHFLLLLPPLPPPLLAPNLPVHHLTKQTGEHHVPVYPPKGHKLAQPLAD
jgi:hypothetical protein